MVSLVNLFAAWLGSVGCCRVGYGKVSFDNFLWCGRVWLAEARSSMVRYGKIWCGFLLTIFYGSARSGRVVSVGAGRGPAWFGQARFGEVWFFL
jgi:hypothetical protein